ncbi:hypothetical protein Ahy_A03g014214 [Arachis hypogaea]|uniref:Endonuclease/exonuclease/phosphatase domain-containing protein n=1 Tax=Arachis hypogaea TaxID=3818 RepID=A0A445DX65_ARAHY|nr:hypothetical protein Ahy_A03g014214 [Arachis hypogaea]
MEAHVMKNDFFNQGESSTRSRSQSIREKNLPPEKPPEPSPPNWSPHHGEGSQDVTNSSRSGARGKAFSNLIRDLCKEYKFSFLILIKTHISGSRGKLVWEKFGLDGFFIEEARGQSGGIWCLCDTSLWRVDVLSHNYQMVNMKVYHENSESWLLSAIYGSPQRGNRRNLWDKIRDLNLDNDLFWCLIGNFNTTFHDHERRNGSGHNRNACEDF